MRKFTPALLLTVYILTVFSLAHANNVAVSGVSITGQSTADKTCKAQFNFYQENSWRSNKNYDAVWIFIKYSKDSGVTWQHATLKTSGTNPSGFSCGTGTLLDIIVPADKKGAFLQRAANGSGTVITQNIKLVWDWGADGLSSSDSARVKVFAIEMVYIPSGSFYLGDGAPFDYDRGSFYTYPDSTQPYLVNSENTIPVGTNNGDLYYYSSKWHGDHLSIPANYPKGFQAFYVMKYSASQGQYRDFLNMLTRQQQNKRTTTQSPSYYALTNTTSIQSRNGIRVPASVPSGAITFGCDSGNGVFDQTNDGEWVACNYLSWADLAAYADWAGLRPITELEYEKAARGPATPVPLEFAWGNTALNPYYSFNYVTTASEIIGAGNPHANCAYANSVPYGPARVGMFATAGSSREQAGSSYYGVMELSGNVYTTMVGAGFPEGRVFDGAHGDGMLSEDGYANGTSLQYWPAYSSVNSTVLDIPEWDPENDYGIHNGVGGRGGCLGSSVGVLMVSSRHYCAIYPPDKRYAWYGVRLVRTAQ